MIHLLHTKTKNKNCCKLNKHKLLQTKTKKIPHTRKNKFQVVYGSNYTLPSMFQVVYGSNKKFLGGDRKIPGTNTLHTNGYVD